MNCIKCRAELPDGAVFCPACGKKQTVTARKPLKRANGTGTVYKLSGRRRRPWVAAKSKVTVGYFETRTEALDALGKLTGRSLDDRYNLTFAEVYTEWSAEHFRDIMQASCDSFARTYKKFSALDGMRFRDIKTADFQRVIDGMPGKHATIARHKQLITSMSEWAVREEIVTVNLAQYVKIPAAEKTAKETFTDGEIEKLRKSKDDAAKITLMLIDTGMRIGELFALPLADCHEDYVIGGEKTEAGRNRIIPIRPESQPLFAYFRKLSPGPLLLDGYSGNRDVANFRKREYYPLLESLGIPRHTPHAARHTYASRAVAEGMPREILQKILGHASYDLTAEVYVHADKDELINAVTNPLLTNKKTAKKKKP